MSDHDITHKEIYDRVVRLEEKVDRIDQNTDGMVSAFNAAQGAFTVLEWLAKVAKPLLIVGGFLAAIGAAWTQIKIK